MTADLSIPRFPTPGLIERSAQLYGRAAEMEQIAAYVSHPPENAIAVLLEGEGGTGKTSLLLRVEEYLRQRVSLLPLYDFYHIDNFKASAIEATIIASLSAGNQASASYFAAYAERRRELDHARQGGDAFRRVQQQLRDSFVACYNQFADQEREQGRPIVLPFDSVEQAVDLSDEAEAYMRGVPREPSKGGALWLEVTLPQLRNTVAILAGRQQTLYEQPVELYDALRQRMAVHPITIAGIPPADEQQFILDQRAALTTPDKPEDLCELAKSVELDEQTFTVWRAVSDGVPFWDSMLLTSALLGVTPPEIDQLLEKAFAGEPISVAPDERRQIRAALMQHILARGVSENDQPLILVLQWMAFIRKGATPAILQAVARDQMMEIDVEEVYERLKLLDIVKVRRSSFVRPSDQQPEDMLFLHDEVYHWLDLDITTQQALRAAVSAAVMRFYKQAIEATEQRQLEAKDRLLEVGQNHAEAPELIAHIDEEQQRKQQLELDYIGYCYQAEVGHGTQEYNLQSYAAILNREVDYGVTLRQEGLRNMYRMYGEVLPGIIVECAARWVLRATHTDDPDTMALVEKLQHYYAQHPDRPGLHYALLHLADAQARTYFGKGPEKAQALEQLQRAEEIALAFERDYRAQHGGATDAWCDFLLAQIYNWRGYFYRQDYRLAQAIQNYRDAISLHLRQPNLLRQFLGVTINNLAFAYAEQGDVDDAWRFGEIGLALLQRHGSVHQIGLAYNTLARIALRSGTPQRATRLARHARAMFKQIGSVRGLSLCLPVLGESYRKQADQRIESISDQEEAFYQAVKALKKTGLIDREEATPDSRADETLDKATDVVDREAVSATSRCETYQRLGCVYRNWGVALLRRRHHDPDQAKRYFGEAEQWLTQALKVAKENQLAAPIIMDVYQDLAVVLINQDEFDQRPEQYLGEAEKLAPAEYHIQKGLGVRDVANPDRIYWRLLGQCQLQRMLIGFGKFDFGGHKLGADEQSYYEPQGDEQFLKDAAQHLVLALAYLMKYAYQSPLLDRTRALALRELRLGRSERQLKLMAQQAYQTARDYRLLNSPELKAATSLIQAAQRDRDLPLELLQ